jgi:5'-nucleotidase
MIKPMLYLDMDGVVANFEGWAADSIGPTWKQEIDKPDWGSFGNFPNLYLNLPKMINADSLYHECCALVGEDRVQFLTALPRRAQPIFPNAARHKVEWIKKNISPKARVHFGPYAVDKQLHVRSPEDILVDDMKINIDQWNKAGGIGILHTSAANSILQLNKIMKVRNNGYHISK